MASESDILVRTKDCKPVYDGDLAHIVSGDTETSKTWADKSKEYADEAAASAADAAASAEATAGSVEAAAGYAESAEASAQAAAQSAGGIQEALEAAEAARDTAVASGNAAQTAASAASQSAQSAMSDAQGAAASATGAALSAQQAAGSASSAAQAAARAAGSATNAGMSKTAAEAARDLAMVYARQAQEAGSGSSEDADKARQAATEAALSAVSAAASAEEANGAVATVTEARDEAVAASGDAVAAKNEAVTAKNAAAASAAAADEDRALALAYAQSAERSKNSAAADSLAARGYRDGAEQARDRAVLEAAAAGVQKDLAKRWATSMTVVEDGLYGARKYAVDASEASGEAGEAVQAAQEAQHLAEQARDAAAGSATTAAGKASEASDSAVAAAGSASAAAVTKGQVDALHDATLDVYEATANTYDSVVEVYGWAAKASADAQGHANDALVARRGAEAAQDAAETAEESAEAWASKGDHTPVEGDLYSSKEYAERAAASAAEAAESAEQLGDAALQGRSNTFTASNTFKGSFTIGVAHKEPVWAKTSIVISAANVKLAGTVSDNDGHVLELEADADRTQDNWRDIVNASELGLSVTRSSNTFTLTDAQSDETEAGTVGNTRVISITGFGFASTQTKKMSGGVDGILEVPEHIELHGDVSIGHGPEGVKARCTFGSVNATALKLAGTLSDGIHPPLELLADENRTRDSLIAEINVYGDVMEITASANGSASIYLESAVPGSAQNAIVFTRSGCFSTVAAGTAQTTRQGSDRAGVDSGRATEYELLENGFPVASRQSNNVYNGVQTFNNAVALNGPIQGSGTVGGSVLAADEAVAFGIGKGFFERDSRVAPSAPYVLYGPNTDSQPALLSMPTVPASSEDRVKVYNGNIPPRYIVLRGDWPSSTFGELTQTGKWNWTTTKEVDEVHLYWPGQTTTSRLLQYLHTRRLVIDMPNLKTMRAVSFIVGSTVREIVLLTQNLVSLSSNVLIVLGNTFSQDVSIDWTAENLTTYSSYVYPAGYVFSTGKVVGCRFRWPSLSSSPNLFQWGSKFSTVPQDDWYYTLSYLPDWTESTTEAYRTAITQYNTANPETPITVEDGATLAELYAAVEEHNTQYPDSECTVTQPHPIGLAAVENCYAAVAQWLDDGGIPYTREPGQAPVAVLPYGWSISYLS